MSHNEPINDPIKIDGRELKIIELLREETGLTRNEMGCVSKKSISIIIEVFKKQKESLIVVGALAVGYILVSALVVISIEPETFPTFFNAVYWATVSLTTVGYGVSVASISNWKRAYREECQTNDEEKTQLELMEEVCKLH